MLSLAPGTGFGVEPGGPRGGVAGVERGGFIRGCCSSAATKGIRAGDEDKPCPGRSGGIGEAVARRYAAEGAKGVVVADRPGDNLRALEYVSRQLRDDRFLRFLKQAKTAKEVQQLLEEADANQFGD